MEYSELLSILRNNMYHDCWISSTNSDDLSTFTLRENVKISITELPSEEDNSVSNEFTERFINETASLFHFTLNYNGSVVKNIAVYLVDGGRAFIPSTRIVDRGYVQEDDLIISVIIDRVTFDTRYIYDDTVNFLDQAEMKYQDALIK